MKFKTFFILGVLCIYPATGHSTPVDCVETCCTTKCTETITQTRQWVPTETQRWVEEVTVLEEPKREVRILPPPSKEDLRKCVDGNVYDYFFFNAHAQGGSYGGAYVSGFQMNDSQGIVIRCPDPIIQTGRTKKKRKTVREETPTGYWVTDYGGYYVDGSFLTEVCIQECFDCPPQVPEPTTMVLFGAGLIGLSSILRRKK